MPPTSEQLWDAIYSIYNEDGTADKIQPGVIAKLIEFKMVELGATGLPQLTAYGKQCHSMSEDGDDTMTEIDELAVKEFEQLHQRKVERW